MAGSAAGGLPALLFRPQVSELRQTALDMVDNLLALAKEVGHMPNGARVYYINRRCCA
jgi:hypothetical protein